LESSPSEFSIAANIAGDSRTAQRHNSSTIVIDRGETTAPLHLRRNGLNARRSASSVRPIPRIDRIHRANLTADDCAQPVPVQF
jgi:hypothetical protein